MDRIVKILLLEDNLNDVELIRYQISKNKIKYQFKHVSELDEFSKAIDAYIPDIILSDYNLIGFTGMDALELVIQKCRQTPFIIVTGTIDEETAAETIKKGAWDYIVKERLTRLDSAMKNALKLKDEKDKSAIDRAKLKISEERFELAIGGSQDGIWDWDLKTNEVYFSLRWKTMLGYEDHEIENDFKTWEGLLHPDDKEITLIALNRHLKKETLSYTVEFRMKCKDGSYKWVFARGKAMFDQNDKPFRVAGSHTDISERKLMEEKLIEAKEKAEESDRLKTAFLQNISHEIRTPLNGIVGFTKLLNKPNLIPEKRNNYFDIIKQSSEQLLSIISDIISISSIESGQEKINESNVNINIVCERLKDLFSLPSQSSGIHLIFNTEINDNNSSILTDETKLIQILTNLINNAIKFTRKGNVYIGIKEKNNELEFSVKDTGIGIAPELHEKIFNRFVQVENTETRTYGGSGLGLSISKAFVQLLGGKIWLTSTLGKGSEFCFTIPYKIPITQPISANVSLEDKEILKTNRLLVVDDEPVNLLLIEEILDEMDLEIIFAQNGKQAVEKCRTNPDISLILMDIKMPIMDGKTATKLIKEFSPELPIIAVTAFGLEQERIKFEGVGFDEYIKKPIDVVEFQNIITTYFKK